MASRYGRIFQIISLIAFLLLIPACGKKTKFVRTDQCYKTFNEFAYVVPEKDVPQEKFAPLSPWEMEAALPESLRTLSHMEVLATTRSQGSYSEIWISRYFWEGLTDDTAFYEFLVYRTDTKEWKTVSAEVEDTGVYVTSLFVTRDGALWGKNGGRSTVDKSPIISEVPVLSQFNQQTERFEFVEAARDIAVGWLGGEYYSAGWVKVVLSGDDVFWVFSEKDGIYSFDPVSQESKYHTGIPTLSISSIASAPDGTFYLLLYDPNDMRKSMSPYFEDDELFQYIPVNEEIKLVKKPRARWYGFSEILADQQDRLWVDAEGYRDADGRWHELRPASIEYYWDWIGNSAWRWSADPYVQMQTSDGRIWFSIDHPDVSRYKSGMAWFDPATEEGCWFISIGGNMVEDDSKNLWLVADGQLYRYSLEP